MNSTSQPSILFGQSIGADQNSLLSQNVYTYSADGKIATWQQQTGNGAAARGTARSPTRWRCDATATVVSIRQLQEVHARCHPAGRLATTETIA